MELHGLLPVDKPLGWTSHDVVARLRRLLGTRRVGHAGTLDPAATGVLVAGVGRATRFLDYVQSGTKEYVAHVVLGATSESADIDGVIQSSDPASTPPNLGDIEQAVARFRGVISQVPPKFSAIKQSGVPLYERARRGEDVDVPVRKVDIERMEIVAFAFPDLVLNIRCSAGTYIRSLARDVGDELGCGAYLHHLIRTRVGAISLNECWTLDQIATLRIPEAWSGVAYASDLPLHEIQALWLDEPAATAWYHGRSVRVSDRSDDRTAPTRCFDYLGAFAGLGERTTSQNEDSTVRPRIVLTS
jgi:tRNA pseudouridine55 synthase